MKLLSQNVNLNNGHITAKRPEEDIVMVAIYYAPDKKRLTLFRQNVLDEGVLDLLNEAKKLINNQLLKG
jgi:hypothetical protein